MGEKYKAKIFKSGNSLALRLPRRWGWRRAIWSSAFVDRPSRRRF